MTITESEANRIYDSVREALSDVEDPEIGINIVDLGLVYGIDISDNGVFLTITLTSAACPLQDYIQEEITRAIDRIDAPSPVYFNWVFAPLWNISMMTDDGREMFRAIGGHIPTY
jgi:metal-sulfur cluster biosynthetic enzyme